MSSRSFALVADVSSADSAAIEPVLRRLVHGEIIPIVNGFHVVATLSGKSARDLNRSLLSDLRRVERRTGCGPHGRWTASPSASSTTF